MHACESIIRSLPHLFHYTHTRLPIMSSNHHHHHHDAAAAAASSATLHVPPTLRSPADIEAQASRLRSPTQEDVASILADELSLSQTLSRQMSRSSSRADAMAMARSLSRHNTTNGAASHPPVPAMPAIHSAHATRVNSPATSPGVSRDHLPKSPASNEKQLDPAAAAAAQQAADPFLVAFTENDPRDPRRASMFARNFLFITVAFNAFIVSSFASSYLFLAPEMMQLFHADRYLVLTGFVLYVVGWGPGPLLWAPLSDSIGRKPVYIGSSLLWTLFQIGCARADNIATILVCRFFAGFFGCACLTNGGGSTVDVFEGLSIVTRTATYSAVVFMGPVIGPIIGGAVSVYAPSLSLSDDGGFRWLFYAALIAGVVVTIMHCLAMETHHNIILRKSAKQLNKQHKTDKYHTAADAQGLSLGAKMGLVAVSAIKMIGEEPIILFVSLWQTTVMAIIYLAFEAFPVIFAYGHGFNSFQVGLSFLGVGVGMLLACLWSVTFGLKLYVQRVVKAKGQRTPEMRIPQGLMGAVLAVVGLFWMGYTSYPSIHWIVPILGSAVYGIGALSVMLSTFAYMVDTFMLRAAPAFAAVGFVRSIVTAVLVYGGTQFFQNLNPRNATLVLACISLLEIGIPIAAMKFGPALRAKSKYAMQA